MENETVYSNGTNVYYKVVDQVREGQVLRVCNIRYFGLLYEVADRLTGEIENVSAEKITGVIV